MAMILFKCIFQNRFLYCSNTCCWYTLVFYKLLNYFFRFQCNEHLEMNTFLCSLACTWMAIIDSKFYTIDSLHVSLDVSLERNAFL